MGVVYRGWDPAAQRPVAIKLLLDPEQATPRRRKRLERETQALRQIQHPHVVRALDAGLTPAGQPYLVLELVEGESLERRLELGGRFPVDDALALARAV